MMRAFCTVAALTIAPFEAIVEIPETPYPN